MGPLLLTRYVPSQLTKNRGITHGRTATVSVPVRSRLAPAAASSPRRSPSGHPPPSSGPARPRPARSGPRARPTGWSPAATTSLDARRTPRTCARPSVQSCSARRRTPDRLPGSTRASALTWSRTPCATSSRSGVGISLKVGASLRVPEGDPKSASPQLVQHPVETENASGRRLDQKVGAPLPVGGEP